MDGKKDFVWWTEYELLMKYWIYWLHRLTLTRPSWKHIQTKLPLKTPPSIKANQSNNAECRWLITTTTTTTTTITSSSNIYAPVSCHAIKQSPLLVHYFLSGLTFIMMVMTMVVQLHCLYPTLLFYSSKRKSVMQMAQSLLVGHYLTKAYMIDWQGILKQENN